MTLRQGLLDALLALAMIEVLDVRGAVGGVGSGGAVRRSQLCVFSDGASLGHDAVALRAHASS